MKIFVISLRGSIDRQKNIKDQLDPLNVDWQFFDAVNGKGNLPRHFEKHQADQHRKIFRSRPLSPGEKGCYASHYLLWEKCILLNENIVVLEDDLKTTTFFKNVINELNNLHKELDYIKIEPTPSDCLLHTYKFTGTFQVFKLLKNFSNTTGYSITPKAAKAFLKHSKKWNEAVDNFIGCAYLHGIQSYLVTPIAIFPTDLFTETKCFASTIQTGISAKVPLYFKPFREIARFIRFIYLTIWNLRH